MASDLSLGLDFGTESVRALLVALDGREAGRAVVRFRHGQILDALPDSGVPLPPRFALQDPDDWMRSAARAVRTAMRAAGTGPEQICGIGVDFTSCTMLPCRADGQPLCRLANFADRPHAWPKLWKHHGAHEQAERITNAARTTRQRWLARYGGAVGLEWMLPKILEVIENDAEVHEAADLWLEAGDWFVWQLTDAADPLIRSTCQAGYKACWGATGGYPPGSFLGRVHPALTTIARDKLAGTHDAPGRCVGALGPVAARRLGLRAGTSVSAAIIDAHAGVPGAGVAGPDTLVMVLGTSSCHMLMSRVEHRAPGVAGIVRDGILPGLVGYETGQAAVGDAFAWASRVLGRSLKDLGAGAADVEPGAGGVVALDWFNGCRTPLMNGALTGVLTGLRLDTRPEQIYRAVVESTGFGVRWIVDTLRDAGVPVKRFVATGGLPHHDPELVQIYADILQHPVTVHPTQHGPALGAAILGAMAAERFRSAGAAVRAMATRDGARVVRPRRGTRKTYDPLYARYRELARMHA